MSLRTVLFWDIDGTLLTTGRAGLFAFENAIAELTGSPVDLSEMPTAGATDAQVAALALEHAGVESPPEVMALLADYERRLPSSLPRRQGRVLDGVRAILEDLHDDPTVASLLLTGNTRDGARAKLEHYGLAGFFDGGAFCVDTGDRDSIARRALVLAEERGVRSPDHVYVIGDTPHDVRCGKAIGARTLAVASGFASYEDLETAEPWLLLRALPHPGEFRTLLGL